jgi:hypothetical protein
MLWASASFAGNRRTMQRPLQKADQESALDNVIAEISDLLIKYNPLTMLPCLTRTCLFDNVCIRMLEHNRSTSLGVHSASCATLLKNACLHPRRHKQPLKKPDRARGTGAPANFFVLKLAVDHGDILLHPQNQHLLKTSTQKRLGTIIN